MNLNRIFPLTRRVSRDDVRSLFVVVIIYLVICGVIKIAGWLLGWVPLVGLILRILFWVLGLYCALGIIAAILEYFRTDSTE